MLSMLEDSTFDAMEFDEAKAEGLIQAAETLLNETIDNKAVKE